MGGVRCAPVFVFPVFHILEDDYFFGRAEGYDVFDLQVLGKAEYFAEGLTLDQLAVVLGKSRSTVKRIVNTLKDKGVLNRDGARKNGRWILKQVKMNL